MKLAVVILDGLDPDIIRDLEMKNVERLYEEMNSEILGCSTIPHTALSNQMIWAGETEGKVWQPGNEVFRNPQTEFRKDGQSISGEGEYFSREDFGISFVWEILQESGFESSALQIPFVLPPVNFNAREGYDPGESWFPDTEERMRRHAKMLPEEVLRHSESRDFVGTSIQFPDKWMHGIPEGKCDEEFVQREAEKLDERILKMTEELESKGFEWMIFGDHGNPREGFCLERENGYYLHRHEKESLIISSLDGEIPTYTSEIFDFILEFFGVEDSSASMKHSSERKVETAEVKSRLKGLGYD